VDLLGRWRLIESEPGGVLIVYGDGKYPQDPPRAATELEAALHRQLEGAVELLDEAMALLGTARGRGDGTSAWRQAIMELEIRHDRLGGQSSERGAAKRAVRHSRDRPL
jgi:hypothetical protein